MKYISQANIYFCARVKVSIEFPFSVDARILIREFWTDWFLRDDGIFIQNEFWEIGD